MESLLDAEALEYTYPDGTKALKKAYLEVRSGEITTVLGPNGAGKSTLFQCLNGLLRPQAGLFRYLGREVTYSRESLRGLRSAVGLVFQNPEAQLFCGTVAQDVSFGPLNLRLSPGQARERVEEALQATGIENLRERPAHLLSFGQKRLAAIAGVIAMRPRVIVMDEPTSFLDPPSQEKVMALLAEFRERGLGIVLATHDVDLAYTMSDRLFVLEDGATMTSGRPREVFEDLAGALRQPLLLAIARELAAKGLLLPGALPRSLGELKEGLLGRQGMRLGCTTGVCAAAAAKAAVLGLTGISTEQVQIKTPFGRLLTLNILASSRNGQEASCSVRKDGGDDPDVTSGLPIVATARWAPAGYPRVRLQAGNGVGVATRPGLKVPVGEPAINPVPRDLIIQEVLQVLPQDRAVEIILEVPGGERAARSTLNAKLGIVGGISILGTTGLVRPMSREAMRDSVALQVDALAASGHCTVVLTPGNLGLKHAGRYGIERERVCECGNFLGDALIRCRETGIKRALLFGHIGKIGKMAAGIFDTHSRVADARRETLVAHAALAGARHSVLETLMGCATTEEAIGIIDEAGLGEVFLRIAREASRRASDYTGGEVETGTVLTDGNGSILGLDQGARDMGREHDWNLDTA
ncbi:MAG: cobalt-precorrin-5B (C(1))-methyltransferase CbiD [Bacillota bacterium]|jgi:cobalamin biosynthesis protein CbiD